MQDVSNARQALRVYCRNATSFNLPKFELVLPRYSQSNFFIFPNYYLNLLIFRDESKINVTAFDDNKLIINATNENYTQ